MIRDKIAADDDLRRLRDELKTHLFKGIQWWDADRRAHTTRRLTRLAPSLARLIQPAGYTVERIAAAFATDPHVPHVPDYWAAVWSYRLRGRLSLVLARIFDRLRSGADASAGRPATDPTVVVAISKDIWDDPATVLDTLSGDILINTTPAFIAVTIAPPYFRAALSESCARRFLTRFAAKLDAMAKVFTSEEATAALQKRFPGAPMTFGTTRSLAAVAGAASGVLGPERTPAHGRDTIQGRDRRCRRSRPAGHGNSPQPFHIIYLRAFRRFTSAPCACTFAPCPA